MDEKTIYNKIIEYLQKKSISFTKDDDLSFIFLEMKYKLLKYEISIIPGNGYVVYSTEIPIVVDENKIEKVLKILNEINCRTPVGNLELRDDTKLIHSRIGRLIEENSIYNESDIESDFFRCVAIADRSVKQVMEAIEV